QPPQEAQQHQEDADGPDDHAPVDVERGRDLLSGVLQHQQRQHGRYARILNSRANTQATSATPSTSAAVRIIAPRMSPDAWGCRAMASVAREPIKPTPMPAPMAASPSPMPAPRRALVFVATVTAVAASC